MFASPHHIEKYQRLSFIPGEEQNTSFKVGKKKMDRSGIHGRYLAMASIVV